MQKGQGQQSNSGDWDGLVSDIVNAAETVDAEEVEEWIDFEEKSCEARSWQEAEVVAAFAPFHFAQNIECDSSYDSTMSTTDGEFEDAMWSVKRTMAEIEQQSAAKACGVHELDASKADTSESIAGLEFSAGVHLIDEMEHQVKQWEEHENMRESAYHAWVAQRMQIPRTSGKERALNGEDCPFGVF